MSVNSVQQFLNVRDSHLRVVSGNVHADQMVLGGITVDTSHGLQSVTNASNVTTNTVEFSNTTTAAAHSISFPLTIHYGMPHGIASSISLLPLLDINRKHIKKHLDVICNYMGFTYNDLKERIKSIPQGIIPYTLDGWGIQKEQLSILAKKSFTKGRMENNIVQLSTFQIQSILMDIF